MPRPRNSRIWSDVSFVTETPLPPARSGKRFQNMLAASTFELMRSGLLFHPRNAKRNADIPAINRATTFSCAEVFRSDCSSWHRADSYLSVRSPRAATPQNSALYGSTPASAYPSDERRVLLCQALGRVECRPGTSPRIPALESARRMKLRAKPLRQG